MIRLLLLIILFWSQPLSAEVTGGSLPPLADMFTAPCAEMEVSKPLVMAIAQVESGLNPWTLNIEGQPYRFDSKEETLEKAREAQEAGQSFDVGLMQVNNWWLKRYNIPLEASLDPLANIYFGSWILKEEISRHGDIRKAVGAYHSPTPARANHYADLVMTALGKGLQISQAKDKSRSIKTNHTKEKNIQADRTPAESPIVVLSKSSRLVTVNGMKISGTASKNSMKVLSKSSRLATVNGLKVPGTIPQNSMKMVKP